MNITQRSSSIKSMELKVKLRSKEDALSYEDAWTSWGIYHLAVKDNNDYIKSKFKDEITTKNKDLKVELYKPITGPKDSDYFIFLVLPQLEVIPSVLDLLKSNGIEIMDRFFSLTEISEYTSTQAEEHHRLEAQGITGDELAQKLDVFVNRIKHYKRNKLNPGIPDKKFISFYPMSKKREQNENWYELSFEQRKAIMAEHGKLGRTFSGKIVQLITSSFGFENWEWGVTLFSEEAELIKEIVYQMRFDEASAKYAIFGDFWFGVRAE